MGNFGRSRFCNSPLFLGIRRWTVRFTVKEFDPLALHGPPKPPHRCCPACIRSCSVSLLLWNLELSDTKSMSLKYEHSSEPLHIRQVCRARARRQQLKRVQRLLPENGSSEGLDCLMCSKFARQQLRAPVRMLVGLECRARTYVYKTL